MRVRRTGLFACVAVALAALGPSAGHAQPGDDWSITREPGTRPTKRPARGPRTPRPPRVGPAPEATPPAARDRNDVLIERYRRILLADPRESFAFQRLLDLYRERDGNVDRLVAELEGDVAADAGAYAQRMLLGHLYRAQSRIDDARAQYTRAMELRAADPAPVVALAHLERAADPPRARE
ncbi:MAG: hypothetical protein K8H88_08070, partial [Sandaracinaceae bacterium]|nr:hypothetical protein [Sandaracinaceae bacterium]